VGAGAAHHGDDAVLAVAAGWIASLRILSQKPMEVLRDEVRTRRERPYPGSASAHASDYQAARIGQRVRAVRPAGSYTPPVETLSSGECPDQRPMESKGLIHVEACEKRAVHPGEVLRGALHGGVWGSTSIAWPAT